MIYSTAPAKAKGIWSAAFINICLINIMMNLSKQMSNSIVSKYADSLGAAATVVGVVSSAFALTALVFKLISGPALDSLNRKYILFGAMLVMATAFVGYSVSASVSSVIVFRLVQGAAQAFTATCLLTLVSDVLPNEKFSTGVGVFALAESVSQAIGPTVGLMLLRHVGYHFTFLISSGLMLAAALLTLTFSFSFSKVNKFRLSIGNIVAKESIPFALLLLIFNFTFCVVSSFLVIFADKQGVEDNIGYFFTVQACMLLVSRPLIGKLADKFGVVRVVIPGMLCFMATFWIISFSTDIWMFLCAAVVSAFGFGACQPAVQALCMKCVPKERRGAASSTCYIAQDLGNLIGPVVAGVVIERLGYVFMWRTMTLPVILSAVYLILIRRRVKEVEQAFCS